MKIAITGIGGSIGIVMKEECIKSGWEVSSFDPRKDSWSGDQVDALILCQGGTGEDTMDVFDKNVFAVRKVLSRAVDMIKKNGIVLVMTSRRALVPNLAEWDYSAAKAAVSNFTQWLAVHLAQEYNKKIRVNAIAPGFFLTTQNKFLLTDEKGGLTQRGQSIINHTPMGKFGEQSDLAGICIYLASSASGFVTGTVIPVDGGFSAFSGV